MPEKNIGNKQQEGQIQSSERVKPVTTGSEVGQYSKEKVEKHIREEAEKNKKDIAEHSWIAGIVGQ